jgi:hypothetical protein
VGPGILHLRQVPTGRERGSDGRDRHNFSLRLRSAMPEGGCSIDYGRLMLRSSRDGRYPRGLNVSRASRALILGFAITPSKRTWSKGDSFPSATSDRSRQPRLGMDADVGRRMVLRRVPKCAENSGLGTPLHWGDHMAVPKTARRGTKRSDRMSVRAVPRICLEQSSGLTTRSRGTKDTEGGLHHSCDLSPTPHERY